MNILSQNLINSIKNNAKNLLNPKFYYLSDLIVDSIFNYIEPLNYVQLMQIVESTVVSTIKNTIVSYLEKLDFIYKNSIERKTKFYINKSNVKRTITTIFGDISFKRTYYRSKFSGKCFFYIDTLFNFTKYDHYDAIIKAIAIDEAFQSSQAKGARVASSFVNGLNYFFNTKNNLIIPRQSIFNWIKKWNVPNVAPDATNTPNTLYIMADEKFIGAQDNNKNKIMVKNFVAFEDIKNIGKNRRQLVNRTTFSYFGKNAWSHFLDFITKKYDFSKINNICLLGDGGGWIKAGINELKLYTNNNVTFYLCEFHFKQAINRLTTDPSERKYIFNIFKLHSKKDFKNYINNNVLNKSSSTSAINSFNYILNNYSYIKNMLDLNIGSSMESHISHLVANLFSSRPKGFSLKNINKYLKISTYINNGINLFNLYLSTYSNKEVIELSDESLYLNILDTTGSSNIEIINQGKVSNTYKILQNISHPCFTI